ncbi:hypothetical protein LIX17_11625 [Mycobacterium avium subsp. hominissuis]|uniref:Uncharacterized protein n=2 Tax=Mycobacterium avium TaxID=1764 RepID=A0A2A3LE16_MYCAV|nr:hypothetical protein [Mycobacterium avium]APA75983.1 hypothetical protein KV38_11560 [Mycobacterium avium subsp. hominissuis]ETZ41389.1 hypothetical protein L838_5157 [Mycobacterium avium MAV_120709_2344]KDP09126.1 hypothetical protein MAV100_12050 [Mycobacterium avium subsp. hominissuis 100]MCA2238421.1 hypothetical protein [Mycobacterium avium]MCA2259300.1 hypothetical protein [Mycobacterium avium]
MLATIQTAATTQPAAATQSAFDDRIEGRLETLRKVLTKDSVRKLRLAPIKFLSALVSDGDLRNLKFDRNTDPTASGPREQSMEIDTSLRQPVYRISRRTREAMARVQSNLGLDNQDTDWMIDNYFIHELLHNSQGMSGGNHSELSRHAPRVLLDVDYQADALAAVTATALAWLVPREFGFRANRCANENHWTLYERALKAILSQMEIFTLLGYWNTPRDQISLVATGLERVLRIATWHYQFHRLRSPFRPKRPLADFQILAQPVLDFRNLAWAAIFEPSTLCKDWPSNERANVAKWLKRKSLQGRLFPLHGRPQLVVTAATPLGTTRFIRHNSTETHYEDAFAGFFDNEPRRSKEFFTTLFMQQQWLRGGAEASAFNYAWLNLRKDRQVDLLKVTQGLALDLKPEQRGKVLDQLMTPSRSQILSAL